MSCCTFHSPTEMPSVDSVAEKVRAGELADPEPFAPDCDSEVRPAKIEAPGFAGVHEVRLRKNGRGPQARVGYRGSGRVRPDSGVEEFVSFRFTLGVMTFVAGSALATEIPPVFFDHLWVKVDDATYAAVPLAETSRMIFRFKD